MPACASCQRAPGEEHVVDVTIDAAGVVRVNEHPVRDEVRNTGSGESVRVPLGELEGILDRLRRKLRRQFTGAPLPIRVAVSPDAPASVVVDLLRRVEHRQLLVDMHIGSERFDATDSFEGSELPHRVHVAIEGSNARVSWSSERPCNEVPETVTVPAATLAQVIAKQCAKYRDECFDIARIDLPPQAVAADLSSVTKALRQGSKALRVTFGDLPLVPSTNARVCGRAIACPVTIIQHRSRELVEVCFEESHRRDPQLKGRVAYLIDFRESTPRARVVESSVQDDEALRCVERALSSLTEAVTGCDGVRFSLTVNVPNGR